MVDAPGAIEATVGDVKTKSHGNGASARVGIEFAWNGFTKRLSVGVAVGTKHDKTAARLQITLSGRSVQKVTGPLADVLGDHTWTGKLCDGTDVSIAFQVVDDGTANGDVTFDPETFATGAEAVAKDLRHGEGFVAFFKEKRAAVLVWLKKSDDGTYDLAVGSFIGKWCKGSEIANPTVNTPVAPTPPPRAGGAAAGGAGGAGAGATVTTVTTVVATRTATAGAVATMTVAALWLSVDRLLPLHAAGAAGRGCAQRPLGRARQDRVRHPSVGAGEVADRRIALGYVDIQVILACKRRLHSDAAGFVRTAFAAILDD